MTTAPPTPRLGRLVLGPLSAATAAGVALVGLAALLSGPSGALGALIGTGMVVAVFAFGAVAVGLVTLVAPAASLLVALLTYSLQVVLIGLVYYGLSTSGTLDGPVDARWLSAAVIACTLGWTLTQVVVATRARQPIYELPDQGAEASVR